jgi:hypothetical protein
MEIFTKFNWRLLIGFAALLLLVVGFNALVDPINMFAAVSIKGFNREKTQVGDATTRRWKAAELARHRYEVIYLGSSRVLCGFDPAWGFVGSRSVYNAGAGGSNFYETYQVFEYVRQHQHPRAVVVGVDFFGFTDRIKVAGDYNESLYSGRGRAAVYLEYLLSWDTLKMALGTVADNLRGRPMFYSPEGFRDMDRQYQGQAFPHWMHTEFTLTRSLRLREWYGDFSFSDSRIKLLSQMIDACREDGIQLYLYINPVHVIVLESERIIGLQPENERWRRELARLIADKDRTGPPVALWDFSGYNLYTTEETPPPTDVRRRMIYFWDGSHCTARVGSMMLRIMAGQDPAAIGAPEDFGRRLEPDTIEAVLALDRRRQKEWQRAHPAEMKLVEDVARRTRRFRPAEMVFLPLHVP